MSVTRREFCYLVSRQLHSHWRPPDGADADLPFRSNADARLVARRARAIYALGGADATTNAMIAQWCNWDRAVSRGML